MAAKILITGATGVVGLNIVKTLVRKDIEVRAAVHRPEKSSFVKTSAVETVQLDFGDFVTIDNALSGIDSLVLITPFAREQVEYARRMIDRALFFGVKHIVDLSILGAQEEPGTQFSRWHRRIEKYIEHSGVGFTIIRPNVYMQNFLRYLQPFGGFLYMPLNHAKVSYIDVHDVGYLAAQIIMEGKKHWGKTYEITGIQALTLDDVADYISLAIGSHIGYISISEDTARHVLESLGTAPWMAAGLLELYSMQRLGKHALISTTFEEITGKKPLLFEQFVQSNNSVFRAIVQHEHHTYLS